MRFADLPPFAQTTQAGPVPEITDQDARDLRRLVEELEHPWYGYTPTPVMLAFHASLERKRYVVAANQVGKTMGAAREMWMLSTGTHPYRPSPSHPGVWLIACGSYEGTAYEGLNRALHNTRPDHLIDWKQTQWTGRYWINNTIWLKNGSTIKIVTSRGGSTGAAGVPALGLWIDEPPRRDKMGELLARLTSTLGPVWLTFTAFDSEQDLTWLRDYLEGDPDRGIPPQSPGWEKFNLALSVANCPWMTPQHVQEIEDQTPEYVKAQRLLGTWESPPVDGYFRLDARLHDSGRVPFPVEPRVGGWHYRISVDHGELTGHQAAVLLRARRRAPTQLNPYTVQIEALGEASNASRTSFADDAADIKEAIALFAREENLPEMADPCAWTFIGDVNTAGKGVAGRTANEVLAEALGLRRPFRKPDKGPGSVDRGETQIRVGLDRSPPQLKVYVARCPKLWRALKMHVKAKDDYQHFIDALRYGTADLLGDKAVLLDLPAVRDPDKLAPKGVRRK